MKISKRLKHEKELKVLIESSWLTAKLDEDDENHVSVESSFGALKPYEPTFYIPILVYMETLSNLRRKRIPFNECNKILENFRKKINYRDERRIVFKHLIDKHKNFSRSKISQLKGVDFYIATEGLYLNAKILTCDKEMSDRVFKYYKQIYFISDRAKGKNSELPRLIKDIQREMK